jgi:hypothetical protein
MGVSYHDAKRYWGCHAVMHCIDGSRHYGIIRRVTPEEIWFEPIGTGVRPVAVESQIPEISEADRTDDPIIETVQFFRPFSRGRFLALPLFAILAISLFW